MIPDLVTDIINKNTKTETRCVSLKIILDERNIRREGAGILETIQNMLEYEQ